MKIGAGITEKEPNQFLLTSPFPKGIGMVSGYEKQTRA
jgi:hypothetical protein